MAARAPRSDVSICGRQRHYNENLALLPLPWRSAVGSRHERGWLSTPAAQCRPIPARATRFGRDEPGIGAHASATVMCTATAYHPATRRGGLSMARYLLKRIWGPASEEAMLAREGPAAKRVRDASCLDITWKHSHVVADDDGRAISYCVYDAPSVERVLEHAGARRRCTRSRPVVPTSTSWVRAKAPTASARPTATTTID